MVGNQWLIRKSKTLGSHTSLASVTLETIRLTRATPTQYGFRNRPGWGDKRMENGPRDGHSGRKQSFGGLGSLLGESKPLSSPGGLLYRTEWRSMVTAHG